MKKLCFGLLLGAGLFGASTATAEDKEARLLAALNEKVSRTHELRTDAAPTTASVDASRLYRMGGVTALFALVAFGAAWVLKRRKESWLMEDGGPNLSIRESVWIGKGQRLLLVSVEGQPVLVGATPQGMFGLGTVAPPPRVESPKEEVLPFKKADAFSRYVEKSIEETPRTQQEEKRRILSRLNAL